MRILLASKSALDPRFGAPQTYLALGAELERRGHAVDYVDPPSLGTDEAGFGERLYAHLRRHAGDYDVVDYDYQTFRFRRDAFPPDVVLVARIQLLEAGLLGLRMPPLPRLRSRVGHVLFHRRRQAHHAAVARADDAALAHSDLILALNTRDRACLVERGHDAEKIVVIANGLGPAAAAPLMALPAEVPEGPPRVAFIGMFGPRKGAGDFPRLLRRLAEQVPDVRLRLLGTRGMLKTAEEVERLFPRRLRARVEVFPRYWPEELAGLLAPCWAGVFPSYHEGFMLAILEMLAAALPVVAYDAPGACDVLPPGRLVPRGDADALADRLAVLLNDPTRLAEARRAAREAAHAYRWPEVAARTEAAYEAARVRLGARVGAVS
ncbi:MAG TPA: glycosyltransferase family 4 protein [Rubricoccaceae bacterium]|nr:glycosyltransferase family 4 protein [Rubricoccaceae bacterium]